MGFRSDGSGKGIVMNEALKLIAEAVSGGNAEYQWEDILAAVEIVMAEPFTPRTEKLILAILRFTGELHLSESSELPHSMSPEDMLKSFAIQWLEKETRFTHLSELQRVEAMAQSPALASVVRAAIRRASQVKAPTTDLQVVANVRTLPKHELLAGSLGVGIGHKPEKTLPRGKPKPELAKQISHGGYTKYEVAWAVEQRSIVNDALILNQGQAYFPSRRVRKQLAEEELALV